ncbi:MAG: ABC transporter permease [Lachnospiraceae bacterium]|nr:ABC transporter permease [Lachnospiraceae bacterium]
MLNLIRMNNYRVRHMTCMYVLAIIICLFSVFSVTTIGMSADEMAEGTYEDYEGMAEAMEAGWNEAEMEAEMEAMTEENSEHQIGITIDGEDVAGENSEAYDAGYQAGQEIAMNFGIYSNQPIRADGTITSYLAYLYEDVSSGILLIFMTIAAVLFFNREQNSGFIKNIASKSTSRLSIYFSKFISMILYLLFTFLVMAIAEYVTLLAYYDGDLVFGRDVMGDFLPRLGILLILHIAFISGVVMVTTITKSSTMGITVGMLANTGFSAFIVLALRAWLDFDLSDYLINYNLTRVNLDSGSDVLNHALLVGIITIIVYNVIGCTWFAKRDIA